MLVCKDSDLLYEELGESEDFDREKSYDETIEEC
jgi:hypothetical protein